MKQIILFLISLCVFVATKASAMSPHSTYPVMASDSIVNTHTVTSEDSPLRGPARGVVGLTMGDVNGDGSVDLTDAIMIVYYSLGSPTTGFISAAADVNGDNNIDLTDAITVVYISLGVRPSDDGVIINPNPDDDDDDNRVKSVGWDVQ